MVYLARLSIVTYPVTGRFGDIFPDLLGRQTEGANLRRKRGRGTDFATSGPQMAIETSETTRLLIEA